MGGSQEQKQETTTTTTSTTTIGDIGFTGEQAVELANVSKDVASVANLTLNNLISNIGESVQAYADIPVDIANAAASINRPAFQSYIPPDYGGGEPTPETEKAINTINSQILVPVLIGATLTIILKG